MPRLENRANSDRKDCSLVATLLPKDVREQLVYAKKHRTHSVTEMVAWLHDPDEGHPPEWKQITKSMLSGWFWRHGVTGPALNGGRMPSQSGSRA